MDNGIKVFVGVIMVAVISFGALIVITIDSINQGLLATEAGFVVSKDFVEGLSSTVYSINIYHNSTSTNLTLYIFNDEALYNSIKINRNYSFICLQSFKNKMLLIEKADEVD